MAEAGTILANFFTIGGSRFIEKEDSSSSKDLYWSMIIKQEKEIARLKAKIAELEEGMADMQANHDRLKDNVHEMLSQLRIKLHDLPYVSRAYYKINREEVSVFIFMDFLDFATEAELVSFFIAMEDKFPELTIRFRFPVASADKQHEYLPEKYDNCYNRAA